MPSSTDRTSSGSPERPVASKGSWLPPQEENLFQMIRARRAQAQERGVDLIDLWIGEPRGPALPSTTPQHKGRCGLEAMLWYGGPG
jgi:hypothetical protein